MKQRGLIFLGVLIFVAVVSLFAISNSAFAKVTGPCGNCHTMHNSQGGAPVAVGGEGAGWKEGDLIGTAQATASPSLTISDCVGCHSSTTNETIVDLGGSRIPIVYNTVIPANPLAGGNFYWMVKGADDSKGHNVAGLSLQDGVLKKAPGGTVGCGKEGCHHNLVVPKGIEPTGCQGCHVQVYHHGASPDPYRFLQGHEDGYVTGVEDPDWESSTGHNVYKGTTITYDQRWPLDGNSSISGYCIGCHGDFHSQVEGAAWLRHPSDAELPTTGEYSGYDPIANYSKEAPAAFTDPSKPTRDTAVVMCLSCHRPHGSPYPDILRWDYTTMNAGGGGADGTGCFVCHTNKDGS